MSNTPVFLPVDRDALKQIMRELLTELLAEMQSLKETYNEKEFCALVGISRPTTRRMRERGELKYKQIGRRVFYSQKHVRDFLNQ